MGESEESTLISCEENIEDFCVYSTVQYLCSLTQDMRFIYIVTVSLQPFTYPFAKN